MNSTISKRILAVALAGLMSLSPFVQGQEPISRSKRERTVARTKETVAQAQAANRAIEVKSQSGEKFRGNVSDISAEEFTVVHPPQGSRNFAYSDVTRVKILSGPLSVGSAVRHENEWLKVLKWIGLGAGFAAALAYCSQAGCS